MLEIDTFQVALDIGGLIAGDQQMLLLDRFDFLVEGRLLHPPRQEDDRNHGNQGKSQEKNVIELDLHSEPGVTDSDNL
mgnify:CR=1 FL=1